MSQQLLLDLGTASARSKGQALRRQRPAMTDKNRKAGRKHSQQNRLPQKKIKDRDVASQAANVPAPLLECQPRPLPALADCIHKTLQDPTKTAMTPFAASQGPSSVISTDNDFSEKQAYGEARRHLGKQWQRHLQPHRDETEFSSAVRRNNEQTVLIEKEHLSSNIKDRLEKFCSTFLACLDLMTQHIRTAQMDELLGMVDKLRSECCLFLGRVQSIINDYQCEHHHQDLHSYSERDEDFRLFLERVYGSKGRNNDHLEGYPHYSNGFG